MPATVYGMSPISVTPSGGSATVIPIDDLAIPPAIQQKMFRHSGNEFASAALSPGASPSITFKTPLAVAYPLFGLSATVLTACDVYLAKFAAAIRAPGSVHPKFSLASSATVYSQITGWSVNADGILMADVELFYLSSDGATYPIGAVTTSNPLPALASQPQLHTLGPVSFNGSVVSGAAQHGCELGQMSEERRNDGDPYPRVRYRKGSNIKLTGGHEDPLALQAALTLVGTNITSSVVQYFKSYNLTTGVVSSANAISITMNAGRVHPVTLSTTTENVATQGYEVYPISATSTNPLTINLTDTAPTDP